MRQTSSTATHAMKAERGGIVGVAPGVTLDCRVGLVPVHFPEIKRNVTISHNSLQLDWK